MNWKLTSGHLSREGHLDHPTITESTTGVVACGFSWCNGSCGLPALVLLREGKSELRAFGSMVAMGPVFQEFRIPWRGAKVSITLGDESVEVLLKRFWM
jgi:hypothetical protein